MKPFLLIVEDDESIVVSLTAFFEGKGYSVASAATGQAGLDFALKEIPDTVILDLRLPDMDGIKVLSEIKNHYPYVSVIIMTGYGEVSNAVQAMRLGAEYYFQKPIDLDELAAIVENSLRIKQVREEAAAGRRPHGPVVGRSAQTQGLMQMISLLAANSTTTVLIRGETGTGKELVARNIHALSPRAEKPFVGINCASIPENIVESELFGYEAGAYTDAKRTKKGLFEVAEGGTFFLDEIGDMPPAVQAKILRVLESRSLKRLGGTRDIAVDVRVVAATNKDLEAKVRDGSFREDLFYRLSVMPLLIPPLRERAEDIPLIAEFLLGEIKKDLGKRTIKGFRSEAFDVLVSYPWPGNVRELRNVIERAAILCAQGEIAPVHLVLPEKRPPTETSLSLKEVEGAHISRVLRMAGGNRTKAARLLGVARSTLNEKLKSLNLE